MKKNILFLSALFLVLCSCTMGKTIVSEQVNLERYKVAAIVDVMSYGGSADLMDVEVGVYNALEKSRLKVIGERQIPSLSPEDKEQLLLVKFAASQDEREAVVGVNFIDYMTGRPIASCRGTCNVGITKHAYMVGAIKQVQKQIKLTFGEK